MISQISVSRASGENLSRELEFRSSSMKKSFYESGHQIEKLEFALAVALTRGDQNLSAFLRSQITDLGGNVEEPGT